MFLKKGDNKKDIGLLYMSRLLFGNNRGFSKFRKGINETFYF